MKLQFSLRSLMIVVTLLAVPCAYFGWQAKIVRERRLQIMARSSPRILVYHGEQALPNGPNWFRLALGDVPVEWISPDHRYTTNADMLRALFPEAVVGDPKPIPRWALQSR
jgi:hypothetical protein